MRLAKTVRAAGAMAVVCVGLIMTVHGEDPKPAAPPAINLGGADRFLTYVATDKPIYRPGEKLYVRASLLHADKHSPSAEGAVSMVEVTGPKGDTVASGMVNPQDGVCGFSWDIPAATPGGEYTVKVSHPYTGHAPGIRKFDVRAYRAPRLKSQIVFVRDGYGPGDTVSASVHVDRAEGGIPANAKVNAIARLDGAEIANATTTIDDKGNASARFQLPAAIARGEGSLAFVIEDGGVLETASKTIPILLQTVDLAIYPEGGDLVAGLPNRVYLEAFTPAKKPADLMGVIVDGKGVDVASFATAHEGRGRFSFTPAKGEKYTLKINQPAGIKTTYPLPEVKESGVVLATVEDAVAADAPVRLTLATTVKDAKYKVTLSKRETPVAEQTVDFKAIDFDAADPNRHLAIVNLKPTTTADGVLIATVWDESGKTPLAERLVFRKPAKSIKIDVKPDKASYIPGESVKLTVTTTDADGKPVSAVVGVTVTDDSVLEMIEKREQAPHLPVMVLLESDVKDLADAHVYLDEANPKAPLATDLLLGTQGWRRFAVVKTEDFIGQYGDAARRVLAMRVVTEQELTKTRSGAVAMDGVDLFAVRHVAVQAPLAPEAAPAKHPVALGVPVAAVAPPAPVAAALPADFMDLPAAKAEGQANGPVAAQGRLAMRRQNDEPRADDRLRKRLDEAGDREMKQKNVLGGGGGRAFASQPAQMRQDFVLVREYVHALREGRRPNDRADFTETLYWNAGVKTDEKTGTGTVSFATSDAVTAFRVFGDAFDKDGALGSSSSTIQSVQPFYAEIKMPLEVTQGDEIRLPVTLINGTSDAHISSALNPVGPKGIRFGPIKPTTVNPGDRLRQLLYVGIDDVAGTFDIAINAGSDEYTDKVTRKLKVMARGFPIEFARGGMVGPDGAVSYVIEIPADVVSGSVKSDLALYPTPLANMTQALEALIQSPCGCFEQTSSTTYPLVMAQQYFTSHQGVDPKLIERSRTLLDEGYKRLIGFECKTTKGYEWFGADPGHDALSAYGLLEFTDMAIVREVDPRMLKDTRDFVLNARDGKGGYKRLTHTLHTWIADPECSNGYNTWALLECRTDPKQLAAEVGWIKENIANSKNSYALALAANVMALAGDNGSAKSFMDKLAAKQIDTGLVDGATTSVIGSGGDALQIETTALATLAWMRDPNYAGNVEKAMKWLCETCKAGRFGSTQSTILALRAIVTYDKLRSHPKAPGTLQVTVDGHAMGSAIAFDEKSQGAIKLQDISEMLSAGKHTIVLTMDKGASMPFSVAVKYNTLKPSNSDACKVTLETKLNDKEVTEGSLTEAAVTVINKDKETIPTPIAIIGIPGGLEVRHDQLKELVKSKKIAAYEVIGREVVLYWRSLAPNEKVEVPLSLTAAIPGHYTAPASRAYLYYTDEHKTWTDPLAVTIKPKSE
ncbi:MAG: large glycoprotein [Phycisphaerales bacterium]|nr:large glycoprotein [Phycisphaerales bacterium]